MAFAAPGAAVADTCPNAALRTGPSAALPDCRAYEQVTPVDKGGNGARYGYAVRQAGGSAVAYDAVGAFPGSDAPSSLSAKYASRRTASGWVTSSLNPPTPGRPTTLNDEFFLVGLADDLSRGVISTRYPSDAGDQEPGNGNKDLYLGEPGGPFTWISHGPVVPDAEPIDAALAGASADLGRLVFVTDESLTPETAGQPGQHVYLWDGGSVETINVDDSGALLPGGAGVGTNEAVPGVAFPRLTPDPTAVSADGSTVFFTSPLDNSAPAQVYARIDGQTTTMVSRSQAAATAGQPAPDGATFSIASRDGSQVLFFSASRLTDDAPSGGGLYRFDLGSDALTFLTALSPGSEGVVAASPDLSFVYACTGPSGGTNLSLVRGGSVSAVTPTSGCGGDRNRTTPAAGLVFTSSVDLAGRPTNGHTMVYRYDAVGGGLTCVSCPTDGTLPQGDARLDAGLGSFGPTRRVRNLTDDGKRVYFATTAAMSARDVNGESDVYQWAADGTGSCAAPGGCISLISSGTDPDGAGYLGASADGSDVYIATFESLVPTDVDGDTSDVYDVRVNGGFAPPTPPTTGAPTPPPGPGTVPAGPGLDSSAPRPPWTPAPQSSPDSPPAEPTAPEATIDVASRSLTADGRSVEVTLDVPGAGELRVALTRGDRTIADETITVDEAGRVTVGLGLSRRALRRLERGGRMRVALHATFTPAGSDAEPVSQDARLALASGTVAIVDRRLRLRGRRAQATVAVGGAGDVRVRVRGDGGTLARGERTIDRGGRARVTLRLTRAGRRATRDQRRLGGRLIVRFDPSGRGGSERDRTRVVLRSGGRGR